MLLLAGRFAGDAQARDMKGIVREQQAVMVDGKKETWRLEWRNPPSPYCGPGSDEEWLTCPCEGYAFGEAGELDLVRTIPGKGEDRLHLTPFFEETDGKAVLPRWPVGKNDFDEKDKAGFAKKVHSRPLVKVMDIGDYDHDGRATEFPLRVGYLSCGHWPTVLIGIDRKNEKLHVIGTAENPKKPLYLGAVSQWKRLKDSRGVFTAVEWACGDHGSDTETVISLKADKNGIHGTRASYRCDDTGRSGKPIKGKTIR
jgi:hypothetical protein